MRTVISALTCLRPRTLGEALVMLNDEGPVTPIAGCTDLYVNLQFGTLAARRFIDLWPLTELRGIAATGHGLRIGALSTFSELIRSPLVRKRLPMLVAASKEVGGRQIQNRGTIGGNIANASPAGDSLPVLAACDAIVVLQSSGGERRVPFTTFYTGYRTSVRRAEELIAAIEVPKVEGTQYWRKVGTRRAQAISKVMCAAIAGPEVRIALGSVAPTVQRLPRTEAVLSGGGSLERAQQTLMAEIAPIDDLRSTAEYRRVVSANLLADFWANARRGARS
jgi:CO/xanthine dehydrogenase FAD-binding subunit